MKDTTKRLLTVAALRRKVFPRTDVSGRKALSCKMNRASLTHTTIALTVALAHASK